MSDRKNDSPEPLTVNGRTLTVRETYTPNAIAHDLFGADGAFQGGKRVRNYLRAKYARPGEAKNSSWILAPDVARDVFEHFANAQTANVVTAADAASD